LILVPAVHSEIFIYWSPPTPLLVAVGAVSSRVISFVASSEVELVAKSAIVALKSTSSPSATVPSKALNSASDRVKVYVVPRSEFKIVLVVPKSANDALPSLSAASVITPPTKEASFATGTSTVRPVLVLLKKPVTR